MLTLVVDCCIYVWRNVHGLFIDIHVLVIIAVVAVVAVAQYDMKMPGARARGLVVDIRHHHRRSCCRCRRRTTRCICLGRLP